MKKTITLVMLLLVVLTITGCQKTETRTSPETIPKESTELDKDIQNIDTINEELNSSDLDNLEQDLQNVNW